MSIQLSDIHKKFDALKVLLEFDIQLENDKRHCLFGPSGCGKTTLLNIIAGITPPDSGVVTGISNRKIGYVFQEERLLPWRTVFENVAFVLNGKMPVQEIEKKVHEVLDLVQLSAFKDHYPEALSGGMKQRVSLARAFAYDAEILLLDEPFKGLHFELKYTLMDYVLAYCKIRKPVLIFTTHDPDEALYLATDVYVLTGPPLNLTKRLEIDVLQEVRRNNPESLLPYKRLITQHNKKNMGLE